MTLCTASDLDFCYSEDDRSIEGFQFGGRDRSIQEERDRRESLEFAALVRKLRSAKWARQSRVEGSQGRERAKAANTRYRESHRTELAARQRLRRERRYLENPVVFQCQHCGQVVEVPYEKKGRRLTKFCGKTCSRRFFARRKSKEKNRGLRRMDLREQILRVVRATPGITSRQICEVVGGRWSSTRTVLGTLVRTGSVVVTQLRYGLYFVGLIPTEHD